MKYVFYYVLAVMLLAILVIWFSVAFLGGWEILWWIFTGTFFHFFA